MSRSGSGLGGPAGVAGSRLALLRLRDVDADPAEELRADLAKSPKRLSPRWLYDARGSALFERITRLPEYHLTRAETEILEARADAILARWRPDELLEIGSGSSRKTRLLLEALRRHGGSRYVALDVSQAAIEGAASALCADYPWLSVLGLVGDFHDDLDRVPRAGRRALAFLGSTIGNLPPWRRARFLPRLRGLVREGDVFLLGYDLEQDERALLAAYDDPGGVTAEFEKNALAVVNRTYGGDLPVEAFRYEARWDPERRWVEMGLVATRPVRARLAALDLEVALAEGEWLRTEVSCKFRADEVAAELAAAGFAPAAAWTDAAGRFGLTAAEPA